MQKEIVLLEDTKTDLYEGIDKTSLMESHDLWKKEVLEGALERESLQQVFICKSCSSSMDVAWNFLSKGSCKEWDSVLTLEQKSGRGQLRRQWVSPVGNIYASLVLPSFTEEQKKAGWQDKFSVFVAWVIADYLDADEKNIKIKWPNDILQNGYKVAGILLEERENKLVLGIGINVADRKSVV